MFVRSELKTQAKAIMKGKYFTMILVCLVAAFFSASILGVSYDMENEIAMVTLLQSYSFYVNYNKAVMMALPITLIGILWVFFVALPGSVGVDCFFQRCTTGQQQFSDVWSGFRVNYALKIKTMALVWLKVFLWSLLLIIPGIIKSLSYVFVPYLLNDYPELEPGEILKLSEEMTKGIRWKMVVLWLSFILWFIAAGFVDYVLPTLGTLLLTPYLYQTDAQLYHWAKENRLNTHDEGEGITHD